MTVDLPLFGTEVVLFARERACRTNTGRYLRPGRLPFRNFIQKYRERRDEKRRKSDERLLAIVWP